MHKYSVYQFLIGVFLKFILGERHKHKSQNLVTRDFLANENNLFNVTIVKLLLNDQTITYTIQLQ